MPMREFSDYFKTILFGVFLVVLPLIYGNCHTIFRNETMYCGTLLFFCILLVTGLTCKPCDNRALNYTLILFLGYSILHILFIKNGESDRFIIYKWIAIISCFLFVSSLNHKQILLYSLVISGGTQSVVAFLQKIGIESSKHVLFDVSGSFGNPGQLGGYLVVCSIISILLLIHVIKDKNPLKICILFVCVLLQLYALYLADSRAAFLGLAIGLFFYFLPKIKRYKKGVVSTILLGIIFMSVLLYYYRPASANGRLLIGRVSMQMIADKPFFGHGIGSFPEKYMLYQAKYFSENPTSVFISVADNTAYPFNELLNITIQQGLVGLIILLIFFYFVFRIKENRIFKTALLAWVVFSMFSYPMAVFPILLLFAVCLGGLFKNNIIMDLNCNPLKNKIFTIILCLIVGFFVVKDLLFIHQLSKSYENNDMIFFEQFYEEMQYNRNYHDYYMDWLMNQSNSKYSERIENILPSCENYCFLAEYFLAKKNYEQAEKTLHIAADMIPTRIRPQYLLWQLYVETENKSAALETAQNILLTSLKVESVFILQVKAQMKNYLKEKRG